MHFTCSIQSSNGKEETVITCSPARFGFLVEPITLTWCAGHVAPLPHHNEIVKRELSSGRNDANWFYPPLSPVALISDNNKSPPAVLTSYSLPATHELTLNDPNADDKTAEFFIALLGLLKGLRLQKETWCHFYKCPIKSGALCDFDATDLAIVKTLNLAADFWQQNQDAHTRQLMFGAIHWHLFAQLYTHDFEKFSAQYMALDTCWKLAEKTKNITSNGHPKRPISLATALKLKTPIWANPISPPKQESELSRNRNALAHEALYEGEPVGFAISQKGHNLQQELTNFVARCIFGLLGVDNEYTRSVVTSSQTIDFKDWP
jgi:hypothetical protein